MSASQIVHDLNRFSGRNKALRRSVFKYKNIKSYLIRHIHHTLFNGMNKVCGRLN